MEAPGNDAANANAVSAAEKVGNTSGDLEGSLLEGAADGRLRWAVNTMEWKPIGEFDGSEFQYLLSLIREPAEREMVFKFVRFVDQKRAVLSRLLVRRACAAVLGFNNFKEIEIARTKGKKPFLRKPRPREDRMDLCNFNFNISHEGEWVVLASEPMCLCGVDIAAPHDRRPGGKEFDVFETFKEQLTEEEWRTVEHEAASAVAIKMQKDHPGKRLPECDRMLPSNYYNIDSVGVLSNYSMEDRSTRSNRSTVRPLNQPVGYQAFQRFWSAKEAFVKARGDGLGFELNRAEFTFQTLDETIPTYSATVAVDGKPTPFWRCFQERLGENHWATVARGPTSDVVDAHGEFTRTLTRPTSSLPFGIWEEELMKESPRFQVVPVGFLVPPDDMAGYVAAGGRPWPDVGIPPAIADGAKAAAVEEDLAPAANAKEEEESNQEASAADKSAAEAAAKAAAAILKEITKLEVQGASNFQDKAFPEALACYTAAIEKAQTMTEGAPTELYRLLCKRAAGYIEVQEYETALVDADSAVELNRGRADAYAYQARAFEGLGSYARALECLQQARERKGKGENDAAVDQLIAEVARSTEQK